MAFAKVPSTSIVVAPTLDAGFPASRVGVHARVGTEWSRGRGRLGLGLQASAYAFTRDFGLPGPRLGGAAVLPLQLGYGELAVSYAPIAYVDTRGTSQPSAALRLAWDRGPWTAWLRVENDFFLSPIGSDEFRTGAGELVLRVHGPVDWGIGGEVKFWTASTRAVRAARRDDPLQYGDVYDLSEARGAGFSHGIACLAVHVEALSACIGVDAEGIRDLVQNRLIHRAIDDGIIPTVDRRPRPYVRVSLNPGGLSF